MRHVLAAGLICILSAGTTLRIVRHLVAERGADRRAWTALAGICAGLGIWATHFVAMLGYVPGVIVGYDIPLTLASLLIALVGATLGLHLVVRTAGSEAPGVGPDSATAWPASRLHPVLRPFAVLLPAALVTGLAIAAMHYLGMAALELPAQLHWKSGYVAASIAAAIVPLLPAFHLALARTGRTSLLAATALLALAVVALHFLGMTALTIVPSRTESGTHLLSPREMGMMMTTLSCTLVALALAVLVLVRRARAAARASERQFALLVKGISDCALYMLDLDGNVASWNAGAQRLKGYAAHEVIGLPLATFYTPEDRALDLPTRALGIARTSGKFTGEGWRLRRDGSRFFAQVTIEAVRDEDGTAIGFAKITRDITQRKADEDRIAAIGRQRDTALDHMHQGLCLFDAEGRLSLRNGRYLQMYGLREKDAPLGITQRELIRRAMAAKLEGPVPEERAEASHRNILKSLTDPVPAPIISEYSENFVVAIANRRLPDGGWVSTFDDITSQRKSEARIAYMALHDGLTGLPNRARLNMWLDEALEQARETHQKLAVAVFDLNRFKEINDSFGHAWGDAVLVEVARRLNAALEPAEFAARLGGDEFGLARIYESPAELNAFVRRLEATFEPAFEYERHTLHFGASIGVAAFPADGDEREILLNNADLAMYRAKEQISENLAFYEPAMDERARERRKLAGELRHAIARDELALLYQPQCLLADGCLSGYEALLRWHHPERGLIGPDLFIPIAEEAGLIIAIGEWVLEQACLEAMQWPYEHRIAVNLSPIQLVQPGIAETVTRVLARTGLPPCRLELEITESAIITDKARALHNLRQIKALGVAIAMDDFGTGYSSLDTLRSFPFDKIKIDKSFLLESDESAQAQAIIRAVLALGQSLDIPVLAEGVETLDHLEMLRAEGCQEAQGYYLGRPGEAPSRHPLVPCAGLLSPCGELD